MMQFPSMAVRVYLRTVNPKLAVTTSNGRAKPRPALVGLTLL